mmetsp:Transcript_4304/g.12422  ORF Transcript_4304/g.12422 Transcript_4304/m.12422 type:complete len:205 (-) Transcript_4304:695-1309(-)
MLGLPLALELAHVQAKLGAQYLLILKVLRVPDELILHRLALPVLKEDLGPNGADEPVSSSVRVVRVLVEHSHHRGDKGDETEEAEVVGVEVDPGEVERDLLAEVVADLPDGRLRVHGRVDPRPVQLGHALLILEAEVRVEDAFRHQLVQVYGGAAGLLVVGGLNDMEEAADALEGGEEALSICAQGQVEAARRGGSGQGRRCAE